MAKNWHVAQAVRHKEIAASMSVVERGFEAYVPLIQQNKRIGRHLILSTVPRFGTYIFVKFDRDVDNWGALRLGVHPGQKSFFTRILCASDGRPSLIPDEAMKAIREYIPPAVEAPAPVIYQPGQRVVYIIAGVRREGVFVEYCGKRPFIRTWILGSEHVTEVSSAQLEPFDLDSESDLSARCGV